MDSTAPLVNVTGTAISNPAGGQDVKVNFSKQFGADNAHITTGASVAGNSLVGGPPAIQKFVSAGTANGHGLSLTRTDVPGVSSTITHSAQANLFKNDHHNVTAHAFANNVRQNDGFKFNTNGGGLNYNNFKGHGASVGITNMPGGQVLDLGARANVFQSPGMSFDVMANSRRGLSGPFQGKSDFGVFAGFRRDF